MTAGPNWKLEDNLKTVTITFPTTPSVALQLTLSDIEDMLKNLGNFRALMQPPVASDFSLGQTVLSIPDPRWVAEPDALLGNSILHLRDPRFGWLHYLIPRETAKKLSDVLKNQAESPPPALGSGKPN